MPRNGSSVYSLPAGNPVIPGTVIATTWANTTLTDIATALTNSLSTDGSTASVSLAGKTIAGGIFNGPAVAGILTLTGGQIAFPAVQVASAGANVLDDYEEGTWTPVLTYATPGNLNVAYSSRSGFYTKIGRLVNLVIGFDTSTYTHTTASGAMQITGSPFASAATAGTFGTTGSPVLYSGLTIAATISGTMSMIKNSSLVEVYVTVAGTPSSATALTAADHVSGTGLNFYTSITYEAAS